MDCSDFVQQELIKTGLTIVTLGVGWLLGQRIIAYWDLKKKRQGLDIETATQFHRLYGEFKDISRLWRAYRYEGKKLEYPAAFPIELLGRASAAEGGVEAIVLKLATEKNLEEEDIKTLGLFRQAYQELRVAIRGDMSFEWTREAPEYVLYNDLASETACIISWAKARQMSVFWDKTRRRSALAEAPRTLQKITAIRSKDWKAAVNARRQDTTGRNARARPGAPAGLPG